MRGKAFAGLRSPSEVVGSDEVGEGLPQPGVIVVVEAFDGGVLGCPVHPLHDVVDILIEVGEARGVNGARTALAWLLGRPGVVSLIVGARHDDRLADNLAAAEITLKPDERKRLDDATKLPLLCPYWHQVASVAEGLGPADLALLQPYL